MCVLKTCSVFVDVNFFLRVCAVPTCCVFVDVCFVYSSFVCIFAFAYILGDFAISGGFATSIAGRVSELAAVCRERVVVGAASRRSSAGGAASCQVMSPGLSSVVSSTPV